MRGGALARASQTGTKMDALPKDECDDGCGVSSVWGRGERGRGRERGNILELGLLAMDGSGSSPLSFSEGSISAGLNKHSSSQPHPSNQHKRNAIDVVAIARQPPSAQRRIRGALGRDAPKLDQTSELFPCSHVLEGLGGGHTPTGSGHSTPDRRQHERRRAGVPTGRRTARLGRACCVDTECPGG